MLWLSKELIRCGRNKGRSLHVTGLRYQAISEYDIVSVRTVRLYVCRLDERVNSLVEYSRTTGIYPKE